MVDFAHERWAAGRDVSPELWRCVGPFIEEGSFSDIEKVFSSTESLQMEAGLLALSSSNYAQAKSLLKNHLELMPEVRSETNWNKLGKEIELSNKIEQQ